MRIALGQLESGADNRPNFAAIDQFAGEAALVLMFYPSGYFGEM